MTQYYIIEIQQTVPGTFAYLVHTAQDEDAGQARLKAESVYHQVLASAAISALPTHSATLLHSSGVCVMTQCYTHPQQPEPEPNEEETQE